MSDIMAGEGAVWIFKGVGEDRRSSGSTFPAVCAAAVLMILPLSGCAAAARLLGAAQAAYAVSEALGASRHPPVEAGNGVHDVHAVVSGTHGSGLRLNERPGSGRLTVVEEGSVVTVQCVAAGRYVDGPRGGTSQWSYVRTAGGRTGYQSNAYLLMDTASDTVPPC